MRQQVPTVTSTVDTWARKAQVERGRWVGEKFPAAKSHIILIMFSNPGVMQFMKQRQAWLSLILEFVLGHNLVT